MPKVASYRLIWSFTDQTYQLQETRDQTQLQIVPESPAWLDQVSSFAFWGKAGHYTARKEKRPRGEAYWYAYVGAGKKLTKKYLGKTTDVMLARLEQVAVALAGPGPESRHDLPPLKSVEPKKRNDALLATKLHRPRPRSRAVFRSHLVERLQQSMEHALTLVSAPAGFGKTTLLAQWLAESGIPTAWLSLDAGENDLARFLAYIVAAVQTIADRSGERMIHTPQPPPAETLLTALGIGEKVLGTLQSPQPPLVEALLTGLLNELTTIPGHFVLVLDDYQVIDTQAVDQALTFLLEHLPSQMHLVIATREDPPLPLARFRARGQLTELRAADLRFTPAEAAVFLNDEVGLHLSAEAIAALEARTEGWIAGLQLAALSLQGHEDAASFIRSFTGSHQFVLDYLVAEVLHQQPERIQTFLLRTSILERLCGPLCDAVVMDPTISGQATLDYLERANLFLVPLDHERRWYRYHHLFAEVLRQRLHQRIAASPGEAEIQVNALHLRASAWFEAQGLDLEAFQHAVAANDVERAGRLEGARIPLHFRGAATPVLGWLASLPKAVLDARPSLWVKYASALAMTGQLTGTEAVALARALGLL